MRILTKPSETGDTIIEVLVAMSILALVLTVAYQSTSRSLQSGINSSNRQQAVALASEQIEIIKSAESSPLGAAAILAYQASAGTPFCISSSGLTSPPYGKSTSISSCNNFNSTVFNLSDTYSASGLFTIVATWPSTVSGSSGKSQITLYYR
jgi:type II secretory pathway pseudopilin PulG